MVVNSMVINLKNKRTLYLEKKIVRLLGGGELEGLKVLPSVGQFKNDEQLASVKQGGAVVLRSLELVVQLPQLYQAVRVATLYASHAVHLIESQGIVFFVVS